MLRISIVVVSRDHNTVVDNSDLCLNAPHKTLVITTDQCLSRKLMMIVVVVVHNINLTFS